MAYIPNSGSVVAFQSQPSSLLAGVSVIGLTPVSVTGPIPTQSVSGTVGASIIGQLPAGTAPIGSVAVLQGTNPWTINSVYGNVSGSVVAFQGTIPWAISGSVAGFQAGTIITSIVSTVPSSVIVGTSIFGQLPAGTAVLGSVAALQGTNPWNISSVYGNISGSVVAFQGAGWSGSVAATITNANVNVSGSVVATQGTNPWVIGSIVGTYAEDTASTGADKGLMILGIRNDTVASTVNADLDYTVFSMDSAGRHLMKPFSADESRLDTATSVVSTSVTALFNSVVGLRNYVTDIMIANTGSVATLVTFKDGSTSVLGYTIAPAGGGSNINGMAFPLRTAPSQDFTFNATTATSVLYVTAKGYKAP